MGKVLPIQGRSRTGLGRARKLEHIKDELVKYHGIDLDELRFEGYVGSCLFERRSHHSARSAPRCPEIDHNRQITVVYHKRKDIAVGIYDSVVQQRVSAFPAFGFCVVFFFGQAIYFETVWAYHFECRHIYSLTDFWDIISANLPIEYNPGCKSVPGVDARLKKIIYHDIIRLGRQAGSCWRFDRERKVRAAVRQDST